MAYDICKLTLTGTLAKDPEMKYTGDGKAYTSVSIYSSGCGEMEDYNGSRRAGNEFTTVTFWDKAAEIVNQHTHKGTRIYVEARKQTHKWEDRETGATRYAERYTGNEFVIFDKSGAVAASGRGGDEPTARPAAAASRPAAPPAARSSAATSRPATRAPARNVPQTIESDEDLPF
jgi:single-strand DNA-binding protein